MFVCPVCIFLNRISIANWSYTYLFSAAQLSFNLFRSSQMKNNHTWEVQCEHDTIVFKLDNQIKYLNRKFDVKESH